MGNRADHTRPPLRLVSSTGPAGAARPEGGAGATHKDVDWTILMARAQSGDKVSYKRLLEDITPFLRALAARRVQTPETIEDIVQDILTTVHRVRATYDPARPFAPWLVAIANRRIADQLRRLYRQRDRERTLGEEHGNIAAHGDDIEQNADRDTLMSAVDQLPPGQQQAIRLLKLQELTLKEASVVSGLSVSALKVATHRALKNLRAALSKGSEE